MTIDTTIKQIPRKWTKLPRDFWAGIEIEYIIKNKSVSLYCPKFRGGFLIHKYISNKRTSLRKIDYLSEISHIYVVYDIVKIQSLIRLLRRKRLGWCVVVHCGFKNTKKPYKVRKKWL